MTDETAAGSKERVKRGPRSPSYPYISLPEALKRAEQLYAKELQHPAPQAVAFTHWGYAAKSSAALQTLAALRSFGLVEGKGTIKISDGAYRIIKNAPDRDQLLKKAALSPSSHKMLRAKYGGAQLPSDESLKWFLIENGFNENSISGFLKEYRETISFAKLSDSDTLPPAGEGDGEVPGEEEDVQPLENPPETGGRPAAKATPPPAKGFRQDVFSLEEGPVTLSWPEGLTPGSFADLEDWFDLQLRKIGRTIGATPRPKG